MRQSLAFCFILFCFIPVTAQSRSEVKLFHGNKSATLKAIAYSRPPFVSLADLFSGLNLKLPELVESRYEVVVNGRKLTLNTEDNTAQFLNKSAAFPMRSKDGEYFGRVDVIASVFTELYGRNMVYESTSRSLHLPEHKDVHVSLRVRRQGDGYRAVLIYSQPIGPAHIEKAGHNLIVKIKASPIVWDRTGFEANEAITGIELYEGLPDKTTEILLKIGTKTKKYNVDPYTPENPRTVIKFTGDYTKPEDLEAEKEKEPIGVRRIVIDPGHGGKDRGAQGPTGLNEKAVTLELAKGLEQRLKDNGKFEVKLTRTTDAHLSLKTRTGIANQFKADLLLSIHVNAIKSQNATGSETYYLSLDTDKVYDQPHYDGEDDEEIEEAGGDELSLMLWDMAQAKHSEDSFRIARYVQQELNNLAGVRNRGVKQAPLKVLRGANMPAVLIETAFISNKYEEAKLKKAEFKKKVIDAIYTAILAYDEDVKKRSRPQEAKDRVQ